MIGATSVFTHLVEGQADHYLDEVARVLTDNGILMATFFLFDKEIAPFLQDNQNALYCNPFDPTNEIIFDRNWVGNAVASRDLRIVRALAPSVRAYHTWVGIARSGSGMAQVALPVDLDAPAHRPPSLLREHADRFGLEAGDFTEAVQLDSHAQVPPPDPLAIELRNSKKYISSLELDLGRD